MNSSSPSFLSLAFSLPQIKSSLKTALLVGTLLNLINQWQALFGQEQLKVLQILLTYLVPYCVSSYAGASAQMRTFVETQKEAN